jgi:hypothetical protein
MPPGQWHEVLTVTPTVTMGGHMISWETMHITELERRLFAKSAGATSNTFHFEIPRSLCRMAIHARTAIATQGLYLIFILGFLYVIIYWS